MMTHLSDLACNSHAFPISEDGRFSSSRIVSLYDLMKRFAAGVFPLLADRWTESINGSGLIPEVDKLRLLADFEGIKKEFRTMELRASKASAQKVLNVLEYKDATWEEVAAVIKEVNERLVDETSERQFFTFQGDEQNHYRRPTEKWEAVIARFPTTQAEIEEAWRCWACSRYTAAIFHSLRIAEIGLIELGSFIGVNDPHSGWTAVEKRLKSILKTSYGELSEFEKENRPFLEQVHGTTEALKNAWRNKVSHAHYPLTVIAGAEFHPDIAFEILTTTRSFMRRLAEEIPPPKTDHESV